MKIMKFGGSSMANADTIRRVSDVVLKEAVSNPPYIVVSACSGITDALLNSAKLAAAGKRKYKQVADKITQTHRAFLTSLAPGASQPIDALLNELNSLLEGIWLLREAAPSTLDTIASFGERLSAELLSASLNNHHPAKACDTRHLIVTNDHFTAAIVQMDHTRRRCHHWQTQFSLHYSGFIPILTGFIAATPDGRTTTLGRNGSDYTAAILGACLSATQVEIWTDVDGVYSADPGIVPDAFVIPALSYEEAMELSHFGAKVLHPSTLAPLRDRQIPILVKNTFNPEAPGTRISADKKSDTPFSPASGITAIDGISLLSWSGRRKTDIADTVDRLFRVLSEARVNIFLISQASSQHSLTLAIRSSDTNAAIGALKNAFRFELKQQLIRLEKKADQIILAIVGDGMRGVPGVAGKMFHSLGQQGISIRAIAQGASEHNISLVIDGREETRALNLVHDAFFSREKKLGLILLGTGNVGRTLLNMLSEQQALQRLKGFNIRLCGVANSRRMLFKNEGILPQSALNLLTDTHLSKELNLSQLIKEAGQAEFLPMAMVDCTASNLPIAHYTEMIRAGLHVVTPNKKANVLPFPEWRRLINEFKFYERFFLYQTNVGAGLPVLSTLKDLLAGGDRIHSIEGILSGTLSHLFNCYDGSRSFAAILQQAEKEGLAEPDPREDLSGMDVARKLVIMAREIGLPMEITDVAIENLVPPSLRNIPFSPDFYRQFETFEPQFHDKLIEAEKKECVLRYVGSLKEDKAQAGIRLIPKTHPLAMTRASDNIIAITSDRYQATPLVIQGLGAGAPVTAMGVFSDILRLLNYLPY